MSKASVPTMVFLQGNLKFYFGLVVLKMELMIGEKITKAFVKILNKAQIDLLF